MTARPEVTDGAPRDASAIVVIGLRKSFGADRRSSTASTSPSNGAQSSRLLGANGSGKTTTINILTTLINADGGTASVAGFDVADQPAKVREQISLTGQFAAVDDVLTARENLVLIGELRHIADPRETAADLLDRFDLHEAADRRLLTFSGGMRRLARHRHEPGRRCAPIIFFDEPTTGLDPKGRTDMWLTIRQHGRQRDHSLPDHSIPRRGRRSRRPDPDFSRRQDRRRRHTGPAESNGAGRAPRIWNFSEEEQLLVAQQALGAQHEVSRADSKLLVATTGSVAEMADMFIRLKDRGIEPTGVSRQLPTLDDVFFKILDEETEDRHASISLTPGP